ncbi:MAG: CRISPR-associated DxTHG motif protein [Thermoleophilia bacterium]|jgi:CRISPR-associated DxTHG motif protein
MPDDNTTRQKSSDTPLVLLSIVGTGNYQPVSYSLNGFVSGLTRYAPVAVVDLLNQAGESVSHLRVLVTSEAAEQHLDQLQAEIATRSPATIVEPVPIPQGRDEAELWTIFDSTCSAAANGLVMDVTHGFRSTPLVALSALRFTSETDDVAAPRILYGAWEARDAQNVAPMFDLSVITHIDRWARAIRDLEQDLDPRKLADLAEERRREIRLQGNDPKFLRLLGAAVRGGLPLEAGLAAARLQKSGLASKLCSIAPPAARLAESLDQTIADLLVPERHYKKASVTLDDRELARQRQIIDHAAEVSDMGTAYRLAREWVVNRVLLVSGHAERWLERSVRENAEAAVRTAYLESRSSDAAPFSQLFSIRNSLSHGGFQVAELNPERIVDEFQETWKTVQNMADRSFALMPKEASFASDTTVVVAFCENTDAEAQAIRQHADLHYPQAEVRFLSATPREIEAAVDPAKFCRTWARTLERELAIGEGCKVLVQMGSMNPVHEAVAHELVSILKHHGHHVVRLIRMTSSPDVTQDPTASSCLELDCR